MANKSKETVELFVEAFGTRANYLVSQTVNEYDTLTAVGEDGQEHGLWRCTLNEIKKLWVSKNELQIDAFRRIKHGQNDWSPITKINDEIDELVGLHPHH